MVYQLEHNDATEQCLENIHDNFKRILFGRVVFKKKRLKLISLSEEVCFMECFEELSFHPNKVINIDDK